MFDDLAPTYDRMNHFMSFTVDRYWRRRLARYLPGDLAHPVLDVAAGTGDSALSICEHHPEASVIALDYSRAMLRKAQQKLSKHQQHSIALLQGDGESLPFPDRTFSAITICFGFRNLGHYSQALDEFYRVLVPGGTLLIMEFQTPTLPLFRMFYGLYFDRYLPWLFTRLPRADAYRYLPESVRYFPQPENLRTLLKTHGFHEIQDHELTLGIVHLITGEKPRLPVEQKILTHKNNHLTAND